MADVKLVAEQRTKFGKGAARSARRDGNVPAVIYSHGKEAIHILIDGHQAFLTVLKDLRSLIEIDLDGKKHTVIIKSIQRDAIGQVLEHFDFLAVVKGERAANDIPVVIIGEPVPGTKSSYLWTLRDRSSPCERASPAGRHPHRAQSTHRGHRLHAPPRPHRRRRRVRAVALRRARHHRHRQLRGVRAAGGLGGAPAGSRAHDRDRGRAHHRRHPAARALALDASAGGLHHRRVHRRRRI